MNHETQEAYNWLISSESRERLFISIGNSGDRVLLVEEMIYFLSRSKYRNNTVDISSIANMFIPYQD